MSNILPVGTIVAFAGSQVPAGWLLCDGSTINPSQYAELSGVLRSGVLPNLCGRTLIGVGRPGNATQSDGNTPNFPNNADFTLGATGGEFVHPLSIDEMPQHSHSINNGNFGYHGGSFEGGGGNDFPFETQASNPMWGTDIAGGGMGHYNMQPYYTVNYIIYTGNPPAFPGI